MIPRYSRKKISDIWSLENKFKIWTEIECLIAEKLSLPCPEIIKVENNFFKLPAQRPLNSSLKNGNIVEDFGFIINDWEDELEKEIKRLKI